MRSIPFAAVLLCAISSAVVPPTQAPSFECTDGRGVQYRVWLVTGGRDSNVLRVTETGKNRDIALSGPNVGRESRTPGAPLVYSGWNAKGKDFATQLDLSTEFVTSYAVDKGATRVKVSLVVDHRERTGLHCSASGYAAPVLEDDTPAAKRFAALLAEVARVRTKLGSITPYGLLGIEAAVRRMFSSPDYAKKEARQAFVEACAPSIKNMDQSSVNRVGNHLPGPVAEFWKQILAEIRYSYYPEASRYAAWVKEGAEPGPRRDLLSVVAGVNKFVKLRGAKDKDIRSFFVAEITPVLRGFTDDEVNQLKVNFSPEAKNFFVPLWAKAIGRRTAADVPEIENAARDIAAFLEEPELDPQKIQKKLAVFARSPLANELPTRNLYVQTVGPLLKRLTPRQREDVAGWLDEDAEKALFEECLR